MSLLWRLAVNALALALAAWLLADIEVTSRTRGGEIVTVVVVGAILAVVNALVRPIVNLLSLPLIILTLGLFLVVTNALMLMLTSKIADGVGLDFHVEGFWTAVAGAIIISISTMILEAVLPDPRS